jgi:CheY-like chemotaxis protein
MSGERSRVLSVGHCTLDHDMLSSMVSGNFDADVDRAHNVDEALQAMQRQRYDVVLVNRLIDEDGREGIELIRRARQSPELASVPVMMVSNYPAAHQQAVAAGGVRGFGKGDLQNDTPRVRLAAYLPSR